MHYGAAARASLGSGWLLGQTPAAAGSPGGKQVGMATVALWSIGLALPLPLVLQVLEHRVRASPAESTSA